MLIFLNENAYWRFNSLVKRAPLCLFLLIRATAYTNDANHRTGWLSDNDRLSLLIGHCCLTAALFLQLLRFLLHLGLHLSVRRTRLLLHTRQPVRHLWWRTHWGLCVRVVRDIHTSKEQQESIYLSPLCLSDPLSQNRISCLTRVS